MKNIASKNRHQDQIRHPEDTVEKRHAHEGIKYLVTPNKVKTIHHVLYETSFAPPYHGSVYADWEPEEHANHRAQTTNIKGVVPTPER